MPLIFDKKRFITKSDTQIYFFECFSLKRSYNVDGNRKEVELVSYIISNDNINEMCFNY